MDKDIDEALSVEEERPCAEPEAGALIDSYYAGTASESERARVERHLAGCFHCLETILKLDLIFDAVRADPKKYFPAEVINAGKGEAGRTLRFGGTRRR